MPRQVFVDTSAWLAVMDITERRHDQAAEVYGQLLESRAVLVTTILVVAETQIALRRRAGEKKTMTFLKNVNESPRIQVVFPDLSLERDAKKILQQYADQDFSLADALSFAFMRREKITEAFAYDQHFTTAGFTLL